MKRKKIIILSLLIIVILKSTSYAKYVYNFDEVILELTRDTNPPTCSVTYSTEEMTNQNVIITITSNKEIEQVSGFELSDDKKILTKEVSENESGKIEVRDFSGNYAEVEYNVNNIDKEAPQIIGCEDGGIYQNPLLLEYSDNNEIKEIVVDRYNDNLTASLHEIYYDSYIYYGIDRTDTTLTVQVDNHPQNTKKYRYYINDELYTTIQNTSYTFTGLNKGTTYMIKIEALDEEGDILDTTELQGKTSYYHTIKSNKTNEEFSVNFNDIDGDVSKIKYAVWNCYDENNKKWYDAEMNNKETMIKFTKPNDKFYPEYMMHVYLYDEDDNILDVIVFSIDFSTNYENKTSTINVNELTEVGNYQIKVNDFAGNEIIYYIKVK